MRAEVGGSILQVTAAEGQTVRRGALLARIEDRARRRLQVGAVGGEVGRAGARRRRARGGADREAGEGRRARRARARHGAQRRDRRASAARGCAVAARVGRASSSANLTIRSPIDGVVADRAGQRRRRRQPGHRAVHIIDPSSMRLEASVPSESLRGAQGRRAGAVPGARLSGPDVRRHASSGSARRPIR